jgi:radical SAM protein with 4Fe4S-binding SPASM domain
VSVVERPQQERTRPVVARGLTHSCFFRSAATGNGRKALIQITERCNLHCAHCFVSSTRHGGDMSLAAIAADVLPRLKRARVERVTLTGGEPFVHPDVIAICQAATAEGLAVGVCTNATGISDEQIETLRGLGNVHVNVSFDGFRPESHGRFRGNRASFEVTVETTRRLAEAGLLQGILSTPNALTATGDFAALTDFAIDEGASYVLMNPLSSFGRGAKSRRRLAASQDAMLEILATVEARAEDQLEVVAIRFPNETEPLAGCIAGDIVYVFVDGAVAVCPYLVFAARTEASRYSDTEFIVGNILEGEIAEALDRYRFHERFTVGANETCASCVLSERCGKGCPAAVIAEGGSIGDRDVEVCPFP